MLDKLRALFFFIVTPIQIFMQRIGKHEPLVTSEQVEKCLALIKPGDILLSYESGRPTSIFIKGYYDHAALVTNGKTVMEAVGDNFIKNGKSRKNLGGVRQVNLSEWLYKKDSICVIRPVYDSKKYKLNFNLLASKSVMFYEGLGYDYSFAYGNERVYCSELVYASYLKNDGLFMNHTPITKEILPMDYYSACIESHRPDMLFQIIFEVRN